MYIHVLLMNIYKYICIMYVCMYISEKNMIYLEHVALYLELNGLDFVEQGDPGSFTSSRLKQFSYNELIYNFHTMNSFIIFIR